MNEDDDLIDEDPPWECPTCGEMWKLQPEGHELTRPMCDDADL